MCGKLWWMNKLTEFYYYTISYEIKICQTSDGMYEGVTPPLVKPRFIAYAKFGGCAEELCVFSHKILTTLTNRLDFDEIDFAAQY